MSYFSAHFAAFSIFAVGFAFAFNNFAHNCIVLLNAPLKSKTCLQWDTLPGNLDHLHWRQEVSLSDWFAVFRRPDNNLLALRKLFAKLYDLKSRIWFWGEYNHFGRNYRVYKFGRFSSNFAKTFRELRKMKVCREIIRPGVSIYATRITKRVRHVYVDWCLVNKTVIILHVLRYPLS